MDQSTGFCGKPTYDFCHRNVGVGALRPILPSGVCACAGAIGASPLLSTRVCSRYVGDARGRDGRYDCVMPATLRFGAPRSVEAQETTLVRL